MSVLIAPMAGRKAIIWWSVLGVLRPGAKSFVRKTMQGASAISCKVANRRNTTNAVLSKEDDRIPRGHPGDRGVGVLTEDRRALGNVNRLKGCGWRCCLMKGKG